MKYVERILVGLFGIIAVSAATWIIIVGITHLFDANGWTRLSASDWGTWIGAVGTVGALIGAIWIAREAERNSRRAQMDLARVTAVEFQLLLPDLISWVGTVSEKLISCIEYGISDDDLDYCVKRLRTFPAWETAKLATLVCLPGHVASKLCLASITIARCADELDVVRTVEAVGDPEGEVRSVEKKLF